MKPPICIVCGKPCHPVADRNQDGTHAHLACLYSVQTWLQTWPGR